MYGIIGIKKQAPLHSLEGNALDGKNSEKMIDNGNEAKCNNDSEICAALKEMKSNRGRSGECEYHNKTNILDEESMGIERKQLFTIPWL